MSHKNLAFSWKIPMIWTLGKHFLEPETQININVQKENCLKVSPLCNYVNTYYWRPLTSQFLAAPALEKVCFIQESKTDRDLRYWWIINWFWLGLLAHYESLKCWMPPTPCFPDELPCCMLGGKPSLKADLEFRIQGCRPCVSFHHSFHSSFCLSEYCPLIFLVQWFWSWALEQASVSLPELKFRFFHWMWVWSWAVNPWRTGCLSIKWVRLISAFPVKNKLDVYVKSLNFVQWWGPIDF